MDCRAEQPGRTMAGTEEGTAETRPLDSRVIYMVPARKKSRFCDKFTGP
ncbi:MAG: hypothetical protein QOH85_242 [Acidobacteriaceae bacterium]|jgi:hypothetical protein|nr:hypothetical protein [Acidobacteriaceae bacterium]